MGDTETKIERDQFSGQEKPVPVRWSIFTTIAVVLVCGSLILGVRIREKVDLTGRVAPPDTINGLLASNNPADVSIPLIPYYNQVVALLKQKFVDPIRDNTKLANGAIRGMIVSLDDPLCAFLSPSHKDTFLDAQAGIYHGIGVDLGERLTSKRKQMNNGGVTESQFTLNVPELYVEDVVPGSPADKAGVQRGDVVYSVDSHWVINPLVIKQFGDSVIKQPTSAAQIKVAKAKQSVLQGLLRSKPITPNRADEQITSGENGKKITIVWQRSGKLISTTLVRATTRTLMTQLISNSDLRLRFAQGATKKLSNALASRQDLTIDLRDQPNGDYQEMLRCLELVCPPGVYGGFVGQDNLFHSLHVSGTSKRYRLKLIVNSTVRNAAAIFAEVLSKAGVAELVGHLPSRPAYQVKYFQLPEKCAYTLVEGQYLEKSRSVVALSRSTTKVSLSTKTVGGPSTGVKK